jgi:AcrR family transcriptional regulator
VVNPPRASARFFRRHKELALPSETRQKLMQAAFTRFYRDGFRNVGIDQVLADVGISKTAFYKHFESKEDLMVAALEAHHLKMEQDFLELIRTRGGDSPLAQLRALFDAVDYILESEQFRGCVFVNASIEFPLPHEPAHVAAAKSKAAFERIVREIAERAGADDPAALAQELMLIMEGAYVTRHVTGKPETIHIARRLGERAIAARVPSSAGERAGDHRSGR